MNSAQQLNNLISNWKTMGLTRAELVVLIAEACIGWPYVWGAYGQEDNPSNREYYMNRSSVSDGDKELIRKRCQVLSGSASSCSGCKYYPNGARTRCFDCRGFTRKVLEWAGCGVIQGAGATSQYNDTSNWSERGLIRDMPTGTVCCVFKQKNGKMEHTGLHIGSGNIIHCSVEVKRGKVTDGGWTHYAIPKKLEGSEPMPVWRPTIRKGSTGEDVKYCQQKLLDLGYDLGPSGADGQFGTKTLVAVKAFQAANGLSQDGIVGPLTWEKLEAVTPTAVMYTVSIPHLTAEQAQVLKQQYADADIIKESD